MLDCSITEFTEKLASPAPVPGGGGAAALAGALGICIGDMVGELTVGKKKYADVEEEIRSCMEQAQDLRTKLLACIEMDATAFEPLSRAYAIPKDEPGRDEVMEKCLQDAAAAPFAILEHCCEAVELLKNFGEKGSRIMISDAATGAAICRGAILGAAVNVKVNTKLMKNRKYAHDLNEKVDALTEKYAAMAEEIFTGIYGEFA